MTTHIFALKETDEAAPYYPDMRVKFATLAAGADQELNWVKFDPGAVYPMHSHPYEQISVVVQGRMHLQVGDEIRDVGPGDMWFAPSNVPHGGQCLGDDPVIFIDVYSPPSGGSDKNVTYY